MLISGLLEHWSGSAAKCGHQVPNRNWSRATVEILRRGQKVTASARNVVSRERNATMAAGPAATSRSRSRLAAKKRPNRRPPLDFSSRDCQPSALVPSRARIPDSSAELAVLPSRNSRLV